MKYLFSNFFVKLRPSSPGIITSKINLIGTLNDYAIKQKKKILGVCLGMQLFATQSEEFGISNGLDLIKGKIKYLGNLGCKKKIPGN